MYLYRHKLRVFHVLTIMFNRQLHMGKNLKINFINK